MHETTQRHVCRVAFLSLCVLPTVLLAGWVGSRSWPGHSDAVLAAVGRRLGVRLAAERLSTPRPGTWRAENLALDDPETGQPLATLDRVEVQLGEQSRGSA
ncbi:MAG: hypothetical protein AAGG46_08495, partial [Planctomycetota bacterium]